MLPVGRDRAAKRRLDDRVAFVEGNAEALPFPDRSFDGYTIAFGIRNVPQIDLALNEAYRVLKPGGRFLCLEFSTVDVPGLDRLYDLFSFKVIPPLGRAVTGDAESYRYLVESIRKFPEAGGIRRHDPRRRLRPRQLADALPAASWRCIRAGVCDLGSSPTSRGSPAPASCSRARACSAPSIPRWCRRPASSR